MTLPGRTPLREWESRVSWDDVFAGCGALTPRSVWTRQPARDSDAPSTQRWADNEGRGVVIAEDSAAGGEHVYDDAEHPTGWLAVSEAAQVVHVATKIDVLAHVCGVSVAEAAEAANVIIHPIADRLDIWNLPQPNTIARHSFARRVSPYAVLGGVLGHLISALSPHLYLSGVRRASLNSVFLTIGFSSSGKGTSADLADDFIQVESPDMLPTREVTLSTWEGAQEKMKLPDLAAMKDDADETFPAGCGTSLDGTSQETDDTGDGEDEEEIDDVDYSAAAAPTFSLGFDQSPVRYTGDCASRFYELAHANRRLARVDEVASFLGDRNGGGGGKGMQPLAAMASGERSGADNAGGRRYLPPHSYRFVLYACGQPKKVAPLLTDSDGGVMQRFDFLPALRPRKAVVAKATEVLGALPGKAQFPTESERVTIPVSVRQKVGPLNLHPDVDAEIDRRADLSEDPDYDKLDVAIAEGADRQFGHRDLAALKLHFALYFLVTGEVASSVEAWVIADALLDVSTWLRADILRGVSGATRSTRVKDTQDFLEDRETAEAAAEARRFERCHERLYEGQKGPSSKRWTQPPTRGRKTRNFRPANLTPNRS